MIGFAFEFVLCLFCHALLRPPRRDPYWPRSLKYIRPRPVPRKRSRP